MFIRQCHRIKNGRRHAYWALVESYRSASGPRQRVVAWLGKLDEAGRLGVHQAAEVLAGSDEVAPGVTADQSQPLSRQMRFEFDDDASAVTPRWVEVNAAGVRVENLRQFGGPWMALHLIRTLQLDTFLSNAIPEGRELVGWDVSSLILIIARLLEPASELFTAEQWYPKTALRDLLGVSEERVNDNRLYRTLDQLLPHKDALETHLKNRLGHLFDLEYDLLMYDVTSTYFEGQAERNPLAQRGYSRDNRSDCKQVCIGLVVSRCGMPLGYKVFAGNTADVTTVEHIVETMEARYGKSDRIWVMDRGMVSEDNIEFLREGGRRYIVGTPKSMLKKFEHELLKEDWTSIRDGLEVKVVPWPGSDDPDESEDCNTSPETFILCRSRDRSKKEEAITQRFEKKIEESLIRMTARCDKQKRDPMKVEREIGRLLGKNTRAAKLFDVKVTKTDDGAARIEWSKIEATRDWATLSSGCYLLRTNVSDWSDEELWKAYIQLTEAEAAFRIHKSDLSIRPIWHQKEDRVLAHIFVCFLAYVLWKTLGQLCSKAGLGDEPRRVLAELSEIRSMDVVLPTRTGPEIRTRCVSKPSDHQQILLEKLSLKLPSKIIQKQM
ncbi:IS1634 family transposase [Fuerstiella marisgermanici]|uniref:Transposase n=1 Tax=Fuerstiella marisgermanici TaxID=1891926 RepID=A0A1P8WGI1_9PLAN|nr:IS1634 family transposase [Fuerstiella marisgermanici]APZ91932.1 Transposase [Fuerstiella marisgermanici]APZ93147.1 Transposase [Fuerstiella marisgermanici]APZ94591.1 Transposase [Fuerstiella marisgermanici]APZ95715.1 Transposase [Fuerstiella marisgermanici]APZ95819.1 Transposase [Fuerstiella marisgermanici]